MDNEPCKVRVCLDSKTKYEGSSFNDTLMKGKMDMMDILVGLLRFRAERYALLGDTLYLEIRFTWRYALLGDTLYLEIRFTWRYALLGDTLYLEIRFTWRYALLGDTLYLEIRFTWRYALLGDTLYLEIRFTWRYALLGDTLYLEIRFTWRYALLGDIKRMFWQIRLLPEDIRFKGMEKLTFLHGCHLGGGGSPSLIVACRKL